MQCPRPVGLMLVATLSLVYSMPSETTTTRYTSFEGYDRFPLYQPSNIFLNLNSNISSHFSDTRRFNNSNLHRPRLAKQPTSNDFYDEILANSLQFSSSFTDNLERSRKLKKYPKNPFYSQELAPPSKTVKISTLNKLITKNNTPDKVQANRKVPGSKRNSSLIINDKNKLSIITTKGPFRLKLNKVATINAPPSKAKASTSAPIVIKLTRFTTQKPKATTTKPTRKLVKNKPTRPSSRNTTPKPTVHKIITKWSDTPDLEIKQNWYEEGVPYPNPNPEISSFSPPVSLNDLSSASPLGGGFVDSDNYPDLNPEISSFSPPISLSDLSSITPLNNDFVDNANYPSPMPEVSSYSPSYSIDLASTPESTTAVSNPINVFNLDMVPDRTKQADGGGGSPCPEVHISSSVLTRQQRQDCSDLNLVINSHFHQNQNGGGTRNPAINTYDAAEEVPADPAVQGGEVFADPGVSTGTANAGGGAADPGVQSAAGVPQAAAPAAGGTGGTGGSGGAGDDGGGGLKFPDLKHLFEAIGYLWNGLGQLLSFLKNPYLYIVPIVLFFTLGFLTVLALFPWWIPLLLLYLGIKSHKEPKETVSFYNHVHKPLHHPDGWFWNHQTKTWQNVQDFAHKRVDGDKRVDDISELIKNIRNKYANDNTSVQSWKRRRRPK